MHWGGGAQSGCKVRCLDHQAPARSWVTGGMCLSAGGLRAFVWELAHSQLQASASVCRCAHVGDGYLKHFHWVTLRLLLSALAMRPRVPQYFALQACRLMMPSGLVGTVCSTLCGTPSCVCLQVAEAAPRLQY